MLELGKMTFAVPLPEIFWQVRHQQIREITGSALISYWTAPQRHLPVRFGIAFLLPHAASHVPVVRPNV